MAAGPVQSRDSRRVVHLKKLSQTVDAAGRFKCAFLPGRSSGPLPSVERKESLRCRVLWRQGAEFGAALVVLRRGRWRDARKVVHLKKLSQTGDAGWFVVNRYSITNICSYVNRKLIIGKIIIYSGWR